MSDPVKKIQAVIDRLDAWVDAEVLIARDSHSERTVHASNNRRGNYLALMGILSSAVEDITKGEISAADPLKAFVQEHLVHECPAPAPSGTEAYENLSRGLNSSVGSMFLSNFMRAFHADHPTLQANLYRELNTQMRLRHTFHTEFEPFTGAEKVACDDGRIAGDLTKFVFDGYIPKI